MGLVTWPMLWLKFLSQGQEHDTEPMRRAKLSTPPEAAQALRRAVVQTENDKRIWKFTHIRTLFFSLNRVGEFRDGRNTDATTVASHRGSLASSYAISRTEPKTSVKRLRRFARRRICRLPITLQTENDICRVDKRIVRKR
jgi:hypothetical protein